MIRITIKELLDDQSRRESFFAGLKNGGVAVIPTDTLYGFAVDAASKAGVEKIYRIKNRDSRKPLILFLDSSETISQIGLQTDRRQQAVIDRHWPGALTAVFKCPENEKLAAFTFPTLGIRVPAHNFLLQLLKMFPGFLLTTSANRSGLPSDADPEKIAAEFGDEIDWLIDDGCLPDSPPSTVVDLSAEPFRILRQGAVSLKV